MSQSTKRSVQRKRRREQLLDVAMALFAAEGVEKTTVGRIAAEANVSHGLLYHYFRSKEDVLHAVVERYSLLPQLAPLFEGAESRPATEFLPEVVARIRQLLNDRREAIWLLFVEANRDPVLRQRLEELGGGVRDLLRAYLEARAAAGELKEHNTKSLVRSLLALIFMDHLWPGEGDVPQEGLQFLLYGVLK